MKTVGNCMISPVLSIEQDENVKNTAEKIYANGFGSLLVTSNENFIGIITKTDLMVRILIKHLDAESTQVAEVMSQPLISIDASETLDSPENCCVKNPFAIWRLPGTIKSLELYL